MILHCEFIAFSHASFLVFVVGALTTAALWSQVVINEFSCSNYTLNVGGNNEDFVEFYNPTGTDVDLGGHFLSDNLNNVDKFEIPAGTTVPGGGYLLVICSGEGELVTNLYVGGFLNTNFKINQCQGSPWSFRIRQKMCSNRIRLERMFQRRRRITAGLEVSMAVLTGKFA